MTETDTRVNVLPSRSACCDSVPAAQPVRDRRQGRRIVAFRQVSMTDPLASGRSGEGEGTYSAPPRDRRSTGQSERGAEVDG